ncbi:hypothetical protein [Variovorax sp. JS1663]|uniref:hypothetical protein n=1 Tax=Variovorax sp. JS1663 TaxID=1851577 RepID=UPI000B341034|nr:hypothetical protein [Variovorax sp. JS1663]OUM01488.1 hypothetical protein A8M77_15870 [Variovorax sp. JS1663]
MNPHAALAERFQSVSRAEPPTLAGTRAALALLHLRLDQVLMASTERFDAQVLEMIRGRQAAASLASAATLVDIRTFGWKALGRYGDEATAAAPGAFEWLRVTARRLTRLASGGRRR